VFTWDKRDSIHVRKSCSKVQFERVWRAQLLNSRQHAWERKHESPASRGILILDKIVVPKAMETLSRRGPGANDKDLMSLMASIASGDTSKVLELVAAYTDLVQISATNGASRADASRYFFPQIRHYLYAGDTALHIAAAGFRFEVAQFLIDHGANSTAKNRRGAEPLHYASDCNTWHPAAQVATIECLIRAGADPN
jgi:hypothetical protein